MEPPPLATDVIGLKSVPRGADPVIDATVDAATVETAAALGNSGRAGGIDAPETGGCIPEGMPDMPGIMLKKKKLSYVKKFNYNSLIAFFLKQIFVCKIIVIDNKKQSKDYLM